MHQFMQLKVPGAMSAESNAMKHVLPDCVQVSACRPSSTRRSSVGTSERGTTSVELALILPVFLLLVFGLIELSVAFYDQAVLVNASREGARAGIVLRNPKYTPAEIEQVVLNYTTGSLITFGATVTPVVTVTQSTPAAFPNPLTVKVDYTYTGLGLGSMLSAVTQPLVLSATVSMINE
jgi:Flp pilus assembly protein TadG